MRRAPTPTLLRMKVLACFAIKYKMLCVVLQLLQ